MSATWPATVTRTTGISVPLNAGQGAAVGIAGHVTFPAASDLHCSTQTPAAHVHPLLVDPSTLTMLPSSKLTSGGMLLVSEMLPHVPRFWSAEAMRAPSRAALVTMLIAKKSQPSSMMP